MKCCNHASITNLHAVGNYKKVFIAAAILLFSNSYCKAQQTAHKSPNGTRFLLYNPPGYNSGTPTPLLVQLHGGSSLGDTLVLLTSKADAELPSRLISKGNWPDTRPFIVVSPQLEVTDGLPLKDHEWAPSLVDEVVEYVKTLRNINANQIYFTGISLGAAGCWTYAAAHPEKVAGLVVISGKTDVSQACILKNIPIWAFHGAGDGIVPTSFPINMVNAINACSPQGTYKPRLNLLDNNGHEGWDGVYTGRSNFNVFDWLLRYSKTDLSNKPPYVSAGPDLKILDRDELHLTGDYFDSEGSINNILWEKISGPAVTLADVTTQYLKLTNLSTGTYQFQLTATDNLSVTATDIMNLEIVASSPTGAVVSALTLTNKENTVDILTLSEGAIINKNILGAGPFNIRASTSVTASIRFSINKNHSAREVVNFNSGTFLIARNPGPGWLIPNGEYTICATPYPSNGLGGTVGISQCYKVTVIDQVVTTQNFYSKNGTNIGLLSSWGTNVDGTGTAPVSFTATQQIFNISNTVTLDNTITVSGTGSSFVVKNGGTLTINNSLITTLHAEGNAIINVNHNSLVNFGTLNSACTVNFNSAATSIPAATYGNVALKGNGSTKVLSLGTTTVAGNLTIDDNVTVNGDVGNNSVINLTGNLTINGTAAFEPTTKFSLNLQSGANQALNFQCTRAVFNQLSLTTNTVATLNQGGVPSTLEVGSSTGGGLIINNNARLMLNKHSNLSIINNGTINSLNQTGQVAFKKGSLSISTSTVNNSFLYTVPGSDSLRSLNMGILLGGQLTLQSKLYVIDSVKCSNGTLQSNSNLSLVSTAIATARIAQMEGTGALNGEVEYQRFIAGGKVYRYMSFPISSITIAKVQPFIPITGSFTGASPGAGASLYYYNESAPIAWVAYPTTNNSAPLTVGQGYSIFVREATLDTKLILKGQISQGNFPFVLSANPVPTSNNGWNLLGNPYASPIQWGDEGWIKSGVNSNVYVRDNTFGGGRFLVWNGITVIGDPEFQGKIAQGQSFWIQTTTSSPAITVQEVAKINTESSLFRKKSNDALPVLTVQLQQNDLLDRTYIAFHPEGGDTFNNNHDAVKRKNEYFNLSTLSTDLVQLAIDNVPNKFCDKRISLSIDSAAVGIYTLLFKGSVFKQSVGDIFLLDKFLDSTIHINENTTYAFNITSDLLSYGNDRFKLKIENNIVEPTISIVEGSLLSSASEGNQWMVNGTDIEGATEGIHRPLVSGDYQVRTSNAACSKVSLSIPFGVTGLETPIASAIKIYPNPASSFLHVQGKEKNRDNLKYVIINTLGIENSRGQISATDLQDGIDLNLESLPPGVYILQLNDKHNQRFRFVIDK